MRIWFDILTPKQVNFFTPIIRRLEQEQGNEILTTARNYRELTELAAIKGPRDVEFIGRHGGKSLNDKLEATVERTRLLIDVVKKFGPDLLVSLCSPEASRVAFGLRIKHLGFGDSPHAEAVNKLTIPLMSKLMCPSIIPAKEFTRFGIRLSNLIRYRSLDASVWVRENSSSFYTHENLGLNPLKKTITFRLEESEASYLSNVDKSVSFRMLASIKLLADEYNIVVLSRYLDQIEKVKVTFGNNMIVMEKVVDGKSLLMLSDVFIGSGGTMNTECALLGIPGISYTPMKYHVNEYLIKKGLIVKCSDHKALPRLVRIMASDVKYRSKLKQKSKHELDRMEDLKALTVKTIKVLAK